MRGILPAASLSNVGIYGTGQGYEQLLLRMRSHPLPEARSYADLILTELRKVIPSFLKRVDLDDRGVVASRYLAVNREAMQTLADDLLPVQGPDAAPVATVDLVEFDPDAEVKLVTSILYSYSDQSERAIQGAVDRMSTADRLQVLRTYVGDRTNRRHRPGRAFERPLYRFDVLADYGAFRDLQRHRMLTIEWQALTTHHGYVKPELVEAAGGGAAFDDAMGRSAALYDLLSDHLPSQASYAVALAYNVRFSMHMNAREAMHVLELRTTPQGHPAYRQVCQLMHQAIAEKAGHRAIAEAMSFVDYTPDPDLGRLEAEERTQRRTL